MTWWQAIVGLVYPPHCLLCGAAADERFCTACASLFEDPRLCCPRCAATMGPFADHDGRCGRCRGEELGFDAALRLGVYQGPLQEAVLRCKHVANEGLAELLGERWGERDRMRFRALNLDAIVPVPLHWFRHLLRGYNQGAALAHGLGSVLGVPCQYRWLRRTRHTVPQKTLNRIARRDNVRGAFAVRRHCSLTGLHILLVDDVMATGATASEAAWALKHAGAARVSVAVLARADG